MEYDPYIYVYIVIGAGHIWDIPTYMLISLYVTSSICLTTYVWQDRGMVHYRIWPLQAYIVISVGYVSNILKYM